MLDAGAATQKTPNARASASKDTAASDADAAPSAGSKRPPWIRPKQPRPETIELTEAAIGARSLAGYSWSGHTWKPATAAAGQRVLVSKIIDKTYNGQGSDEYKWAWARGQGGRDPSWLALKSGELDQVANSQKWVGVVGRDGASMEVYNARTHERLKE